MTEQETETYNRLCAEFLGYTLRENDCYNGDDKLVAKLSYLQTADLKFHSDWNWIMEVVEAIEKLNYKFQLGWNITALISLVPNTPAKIALIESENRKEAVVKAINQFLIWYNNEQRT